MKKLFLALSFSFLSLSVLLAQPDSLTLKNPLLGGEKLYLHTDKSIYFAGEKIWFRGYLLNTSLSSQGELSAYIYVELLGDSLISRVKIRDSDEGFAGCVKLKDNLKAGSYILRGYTKWMQNAPNEYMFSREIKVITPESLRKENLASTLAKPSLTPATTSVSKPTLDLQFFPESGRYFPGQSAKIAFKAIGTDGLSVEITGSLFKSDGTFISEISSKHKGMGAFTIISPEKAGYYVMAKTKDGQESRFDLPFPETDGASIAIGKIGEKLSISTILFNLPADTYLLKLSDGENEYYSNAISKNSDIIYLGISSIPPGINSAKICSQSGNILAERLFYVHAKFAPEIIAQPFKEVFGTRDSVRVNIFIPSTKQYPQQGNFSVSVTDSLLVKENADRENILSYMSLSANVKGYIEDAGYYFRNITPESERYLDLVMLTQGWRYYYNEKPTFEKEFTQSISGSVSGLFRKEAKNTILMIFAPSIKFQQAYLLNNQSSFKVEGLDFPDSTSFLFGISGKNGGQLYGLKIKEEVLPYFIKPTKKTEETNFTPDKSLNQKQAVLQNVTEDNVEKRNLKEIYVRSDSKDRYTPKYNPSPFLQKFSRFQLKERADLEQFDQMSVIDYIAFNYPGLTISSDSEGNRILLSVRTTSMSGPSQPMLYVDHMQWQSTAQLDMYGLTVMDLENIAYLRGNEGAIYRSLNGVILITTRRGRGAQNQISSNVQKIYPIGYQTKIKFYSPKYSTYLEKMSPQKDYRNTLYWNPCVKTDSTGKGGFDFYTDDKVNTINVRIEGLLMDGTPLVKEFKIKVSADKPKQN